MLRRTWEVPKPWESEDISLTSEKTPWLEVRGAIFAKYNYS